MQMRHCLSLPRHSEGVAKQGGRDPTPAGSKRSSSCLEGFKRRGVRMRLKAASSSSYILKCRFKIRRKSRERANVSADRGRKICLSPPMSKMLGAGGWKAPPPRGTHAWSAGGFATAETREAPAGWGFRRKAVPRPDEGSFSPGGPGNQTSAKSALRWCKVVKGVLLGRWHRVQEKRSH